MPRGTRDRLQTDFVNKKKIIKNFLNIKKNALKQILGKETENLYIDEFILLLSHLNYILHTLHHYIYTSKPFLMTSLIRHYFCRF